MLTTQNPKSVSSLFVAAALMLAFCAAKVSAQAPIENMADGEKPARAATKSTTNIHENNSSNEERLGALERALDQQNAKLDQLQKIILDQQQTIRLLIESGKGLTTVSHPQDTYAAIPVNRIDDKSPVLTIEERLKKVEGRVADIGPVKFSGDLRLRSESFFGLSNSLANGDNPAVLGNELSMRHRMRVQSQTFRPRPGFHNL